MNEIENIKKFAEINNVPIMLEDGLSFLLEYIKTNNIKTILEVGSAIGFSAIMMASINDDIFVDTLELDKQRYDIAVSNIEKFNLQDRIKIFNCDALTFKTDDMYDLIFIDAAKAQYKKYMDYYFENCKDNGVFVFDNMEFHGMVDNPEMTKNRNTKNLVKKIKIFRDEMINSEDYIVEYHKNIGDGVMLVKKK